MNKIRSKTNKMTEKNKILMEFKTKQDVREIE